MFGKHRGAKKPHYIVTCKRNGHYVGALTSHRTKRAAQRAAKRRKRGRCSVRKVR